MNGYLLIFILLVLLACATACFILAYTTYKNDEDKQKGFIAGGSVSIVLIILIFLLIGMGKI